MPRETDDVISVVGAVSQKNRRWLRVLNSDSEADYFPSSRREGSLQITAPEEFTSMFIFIEHSPERVSLQDCSPWPAVLTPKSNFTGEKQTRSNTSVLQ